MNQSNEQQSIKNLTIQLVSKVKDTDIYQDFQECKANLDAEPDLKMQVDEFRRNYFEIQAGHQYGYYNSYEQLLYLKNENDSLLSNPIVKEFLDAELKLTKLLSSIYATIAEEIDFSIDFLEQ